MGVYRQRFQPPFRRRARALAPFTKVADSSVTGSAVQSLTTLAQAAAAVQVFTGGTIQSLATLSQAALGEEVYTGTAAQTLNALTQAGSGVQEMTASASQALSTFTQAAAGAEELTGSASQILSAISQALDGTMAQPVDGSIIQTLSTFTQILAGTTDIAEDGNDHTAVATWARSSFIPPVNIGHNRIPVTYTGTLSASGSALLLLAKVPESAFDVRFEGVHTTDQDFQALNIGLRHAVSASTSISALGVMATKDVGFWGPKVDIPKYGTGTMEERWKYVTVSRASGTVGASMKIMGNVTYQCYG